MKAALKPLRLTARVTVEIEDQADLVDVIGRLLTEASKNVASTRWAMDETIASLPRPRSQKGMADDQLLLNSRQVAKLLNISQRTFWGYWNNGRIIQPIRVGRNVRWSVIELRKWVEAGCPTQQEWEKLQSDTPRTSS